MTGQQPQTGMVRSFNVAKGFGFIVPYDGGEDVFALFCDFLVQGSTPIAPRQRVSFFVKQGEKGIPAVEIRLISGATGRRSAA